MIVIILFFFNQIGQRRKKNKRNQKGKIFNLYLSFFAFWLNQIIKKKAKATKLSKYRVLL